MYSIKKIEIDLTGILYSIQYIIKEMSITIEMLTERVAELEKQMASVMAKLGEDPSEKPKKEKKEKKDKSPKKEKVDGDTKKKRGMTGYLLYAKEKRPEVKKELVDGGNDNPKPTEVITEVAKRWKALTDEDREVWNERAKVEDDVE